MDGIPALGLAYNLFSSLATGIMVVLLRKVCLILMTPPFSMSIMEITLLKLAVAEVFLIPAAFIVDVGVSNPTATFEMSRVPYVGYFIAGGIVITMGYAYVLLWTFLPTSPIPFTPPQASLSVVVVTAPPLLFRFQSLVVALTSVFRSSAVGVIQDADIIPQIALFAILADHIPEKFHIVVRKMTTPSFNLEL